MNSRTPLHYIIVFALATLPGLAQAQTQPSYEGLTLPLHEVTLSAAVQGQVEKIDVREGDTVKAGDRLAHLYSRVEELEMERARAAVEKREFEFKGSQNLHKDKLISDDDALAARIELDLARLTFEIAEQRCAQRDVTAPIDGIVVERKVEVGETVDANQPLFVLVDIHQVYVQFYVPAEALGHVRTGMKAAARFPELDGRREFPAVVDFVDPRVDAASGLARVRVLLDNKDGVLKAGLRSSVRLIP